MYRSIFPDCPADGFHYEDIVEISLHPHFVATLFTSRPPPHLPRSPQHSSPPLPTLIFPAIAA